VTREPGLQRLARYGRGLTVAAGAAAALDLLHGVVAGRYVVAYAWLHLAVLAFTAGALLVAGVSGRASPWTIPALGVLIGAELPWSGAGALNTAALLPLVVAGLAALALLALTSVDPGEIDVKLASEPGTAGGQRATRVGPGWYPDPTDPTWLRWWDGRTWTAARHRAAP
jgi:hypothetical protein